MKFQLRLRGGWLPLLALCLLVFTAKTVFSTRPISDRLEPEALPPVAPAHSAMQSFVVGAGLVEPRSEIISIAAQISGLIREVRVKPGDEVEPGDVLFMLDDSDAQAEVAIRRAAVETLKAQIEAARIELAQAGTELRRATELAATRTISEQEATQQRFTRDLAQARKATLIAQSKEAEAQLTRALVQVNWHTVRAPIHGVILQARLRVGEIASNTRVDEPLLQLGDIRMLHVRVDIDEADIHRLVQGASATVSARGEATRTVTAAFVRIEPLIVPKKSLTNAADERVDTRVMQVIYALPSKAVGFWCGQQVDVFIEG